MKRASQLCCLAIAAQLGVALGVVSASAAAEPDGRAIYSEACAACHGEDGRGRSQTGVTVPLPDFTDCRITTAEPDSNWRPLVAHGGVVLGLSSSMPSFDGALTPEEQRAALAYVRSFCTDPAWPRGELNFPQPVFVGKAFPEEEVIIHSGFVDSGASRGIAGEPAIEHRIGARGQVELAVPFGLNDEKHGGPTAGGLGDLALAYKQVVYASLDDPRAIVSLQTDLVLPTGEPSKGTGDGTVSFEPALLTGSELAGFILQTQFRAVLPIETSRAARVFLYRFALQYPLGPMRRSLVPALEFESAQRIEGSFHDYTVLGPTFYVPLSLRGHVALGFGGQVPVSAHRPFDYQLGAFLLWDFLDGPLW